MTSSKNRSINLEKCSDVRGLVQSSTQKAGNENVCNIAYSRQRSEFWSTKNVLRAFFILYDTDESWHAHTPGGKCVSPSLKLSLTGLIYHACFKQKVPPARSWADRSAASEYCHRTSPILTLLSTADLLGIKMCYSHTLVDQCNDLETRRTEKDQDDGQDEEELGVHLSGW